ncbi:hypothetical protein EU800_19210 [Tropicimonas sp. IMCC6043]|nr:hypothetical protein EU800_19210 [Tropicimonas sp. IMCC6043]
MWFDVNAALAEIEGGTKSVTEAQPPATTATTATTATKPVRVANVAGVATLSTPKAEAIPHCAARRVAEVADVATPETLPHGVSVAGSPLTWTGRVVSLEAWRRLSEWERHGPDGRLWNGLTREWETVE